MKRHATRAAMALPGISALREVARRTLKRLLIRQREFSIGIYEGPSPFELQPMRGGRYPMMHRRCVNDTQADFVADPFMVCDGETWYLFFEIWNYATQRGCVGLATSDQKRRRWRYRGVVLDEPFHLSYPLVFRWENSWYMVPETSEAGEVRLYRAARFPVAWEKVATLLPLPDLVDPTLFFYDQQWWMFVTEGAQTHGVLRLYLADALEGPWHEHPHSPLLRDDPARARSAGRVIFYDHRLFRLAQDCATAYGASVRVFEIRTLTPTHYEEQELDGSPTLRGSGRGWNGLGMHHIDAHPAGDGRWVACVDGWTYALRRRKRG